MGMVRTILLYLQYYLLGSFIVSLIISLIGIKKPKKIYYRSFEEKNSYLILIPAHNEEQVIEKNLDRIYNCSYDRRKLRVVVCCDNCTDNTIKVVKRFANSHEDLDIITTEVNGGTKGKNLELSVAWLIEHGLYDKDNVVVIDADNNISSTMFNCFNYWNIKGEKIVQVAIRSLNEESFIAKGFTASFSSMNVGHQLARMRLGLSGSLCGTCFSVERELFLKEFLKCQSLTEDLEASIECICKGYKIKFDINEYVLNENLDKLKPANKQRIRWNKGHINVMLTKSIKLMKYFFKNPVQAIDSLHFITSPLRYVLFVVGVVLGVVVKPVISKNILIISLLSLIIYLLHTLYCVNFKIRYLLPSIWYSITMIYCMMVAVFDYRNKTWAKTKHVGQQG